MRYSTAQFGETARLLGDFAEGRPLSALSGVNIELYDLATQAGVSLSASGCTEISGSRTGGFASYVWPTSSLTTQPTSEVEYLYVMRDTQTSRVHKGKLVLGGHSDESAIQRYRGGVSIDTISGAVGTTFPLGTPESPVSNLADALSIRSTFNLPRVLRVRGALTLSGDLTRFAFEGQDPLNDRVTAASGCVLNGAGFERLTIAGDFSTTPSGVVGSELTIGVTGQTISGLRGLFLTALVRGTIRPATSLIGLDVSTDEAFGAVIEMAGAPITTRVAIGAVIGTWVVQGGTSADHQVGIGGNGARITLGASTTGGVYIFSGVGELDDQATGWNALTDTLVRGTRLDVLVSSRAVAGDAMALTGAAISGVADQVWDEALAGHLTAGSTGAALSGASGLAPTAAAIADAVWDEPLAGHLSGGSTGARLEDTSTHGEEMDLLDQAVDSIWDEDQADHLSVGSTGESLFLAASGAVSGSTGPTAAAIADAVWDEANADHVASGSTGLTVLDARRHITNRRQIDDGTTPWQEVVFGDDGVTEIQRADLFDLNGDDISGTNRPSGTLIAERDPV